MKESVSNRKSDISVTEGPISFGGPLEFVDRLAVQPAVDGCSGENCEVKVIKK